MSCNVKSKIRGLNDKGRNNRATISANMPTFICASSQGSVNYLLATFSVHSLFSEIKPNILFEQKQLNFNIVQLTYGIIGLGGTRNLGLNGPTFLQFKRYLRM